jgi:hypothetical protein
MSLQNCKVLDECKYNALTEVRLWRAGDPGEEGGGGCEDEAHLRSLHPLIPQLQQPHQVTSLPALCNTSNMSEKVKLLLISYRSKFCAKLLRKMFFNLPPSTTQAYIEGNNNKTILWHSDL